jgi:murein DD-endopeptidase MepM/ murein hydrolase activator NlpD
VVQPGQTLRLPRPRIHRIETGDTIYNIARRYGVDQSALVRLNELEPPYGIRAGETLRLPRAAAVAERRQADEEPPERTAAWEGDAEAETSRTGTSSAAIQATLGPPERTGARFQLPVRGEVISAFGPKDGGLRNDGINFGTREGATVVAAEAGTVAYAGNELRGFGNLILIRHEGGWITAYAHNARLLVEPGTSVRRGQPIALAGQTGSVDRPQLHFEIRRGRRPVDPQPLL